MNFPNLFNIYAILKHSLHCPHCGNKCPHEELEIVDICENDCTVLSYCEPCDIEIEAEVLLFADGQSPSITITAHERITEQDIENVSKALSSHKGSLKKLFGKAGKSNI